MCVWRALYRNIAKTSFLVCKSYDKGEERKHKYQQQWNIVNAVR